MMETGQSNLDHYHTSSFIIPYPSLMSVNGLDHMREIVRSNHGAIGAYPSSYALC